MYAREFYIAIRDARICTFERTRNVLIFFLIFILKLLHVSRRLKAKNLGKTLDWDRRFLTAKPTQKKSQTVSKC